MAVNHFQGVAQFHLQKLIPDDHFNDGTLVVAPCNSPEQPPVTFGCSHSQQIIWQVFSAIEKGASAAGETDSDFLTSENPQTFIRRTTLNECVLRRNQQNESSNGQGYSYRVLGSASGCVYHLDYIDECLIHFPEWKIDMDSPNDTHRHLSHLVGLYPGYAVSNFNSSLQVSNLTYAEVIDAATISLIHRRNGTGPDADAGWEKAWRAACWAQLGNASEFFFELSVSFHHTIQER